MHISWLKSFLIHMSADWFDSGRKLLFGNKLTHIVSFQFFVDIQNEFKLQERVSNFVYCACRCSHAKLPFHINKLADHERRLIVQAIEHLFTLFVPLWVIEKLTKILRKKNKKNFEPYNFLQDVCLGLIQASIRKFSENCCFVWFLFDECYQALK